MKWDWAKERTEEIMKAADVEYAVYVALQRLSEECANEALIATQRGDSAYQCIKARFPRDIA